MITIVFRIVYFDNAEVSVSKMRVFGLQAGFVRLVTYSRASRSARRAASGASHSLRAVPN